MRTLSFRFLGLTLRAPMKRACEFALAAAVLAATLPSLGRADSLEAVRART